MVLPVLPHVAPLYFMCFFLHQDVFMKHFYNKQHEKVQVHENKKIPSELISTHFAMWSKTHHQTLLVFHTHSVTITVSYFVLLGIQSALSIRRVQYYDIFHLFLCGLIAKLSIYKVQASTQDINEFGFTLITRCVLFCTANEFPI